MALYIGTAPVLVLTGICAQATGVVIMNTPKEINGFSRLNCCHLLRRLDQSAGVAASDDLYLPGVFRTTLWPEEDSTFTIIVTTEELSSQTINTRQLTLSYNNAVEDQRSNVQPQGYFGEGGETVHTLPILPITNLTQPSEADEEYFHLLRQAGG